MKRIFKKYLSICVCITLPNIVYANDLQNLEIILQDPLTRFFVILILGATIFFPI